MTADDKARNALDAQIIDLVVASGRDYPTGRSHHAELDALVEEWAAPLRSSAFDALESEDPRTPGDYGGVAIWCDLRPSEAVILRDAVDQAIARAVKRCKEVIVTELVIAGREFAAAVPDAPRMPLELDREHAAGRPSQARGSVRGTSCALDHVGDGQ